MGAATALPGAAALAVGGADDSHVGININPLELDQIFVPYTGATHDTDLGAKNLATTGSIGVTGSRVLKGWFLDLECTNAITVSGAAVLTE